MDKRVRQDGFNRILFVAKPTTTRFICDRINNVDTNAVETLKNKKKKNTCARQQRQTITNITSHDFRRFEQPRCKQSFFGRVWKPLQWVSSIGQNDASTECRLRQVRQRPSIGPFRPVRDTAEVFGTPTTGYEW